MPHQYLHGGNMIGTLANLALVAAFLFSLLASLGYLFGALWRNENLIITARRSNWLVFVMILLCYGLLTWAFFSNDFSINFVFKNSSHDLPLFYKLTGPWSGLEGSLLLWALLLAFFSVFLIGLKSNRARPRLAATSLFVLMAIELFLLSLLTFTSNPTASLFPAPLEGRGMNPLLQNPGMVFHPPMLYLGFIGISIPFAYSVGSLVLGKMDSGWIQLTRRWALVAWLFLSAGMILGGLWAYHVLGWGGFWAWDPVENSSLLPWLAITTYLHSSMVQERTDGLKVWNIFLVILAFELTILGTFITRSGVLNSVHAFSNSNLGLFFLVFMALSLFASFGLLIWRMDQLGRTYQTKEWWSKENFFLVNNFLFLVVIFTVLYGTLYPLIAEALAMRKISIQAPYFNSINFPLAVLILLLMSITPYLSWQRMKLVNLRRLLWLPVGLSLIFGGGFYFFGLKDVKFSVSLAVLVFAAWLVLKEGLRLVRSRYRARLAAPKNTKGKKIFSRKLGATLVHFGILLAFVSFLGKYLSLEEHINLAKNNAVQVAGYELLYKQDVQNQNSNRLEQQAWIDLYYNGERITTLKPAKAFYPTSPEPISLVDIYRKPWEDVYVSLAGFNPDGSIGLNVYLNRLILFLPLSLVFFVAGFVLSFCYKDEP